METRENARRGRPHWSSWGQIGLILIGSALLIAFFIRVAPAQAGPNRLLNPPTTYWGVVAAGQSFTPTVGLPVYATIGGVLCGQTAVQENAGQLYYAINVSAGSGPGSIPGCGFLGSIIDFEVGGRRYGPQALWDNSQVWEHNLRPWPAALDDTAITAEDSAVQIDILANDSDPALLISQLGAPAHGAAVLIGSQVRYTPTLNFYGLDTFTYTVQDGGGLADSALVTVTVTAVNDPPVAAPNSYVTAEDTLLTVAAPGLLGNDTDVDSAPLTAAVAQPPAAGNLQLSLDGGLVYTPALNFNGLVSFTYLASDGVLTDTALVTITVVSVNDPPVVEAGLDQAAVEGAAVAFNGSFVDPGRLRGPFSGELIHWDFGDGGAASGVLTPTHVYADNGVYTATLTVTDTLGGVGVDSLQVTVGNAAPLLGPLPDRAVVAGETLTVTGTFSDAGWLDTHLVSLAWGDGLTDTLNLPAGPGGFSLAHAYSAAGAYTATLTVIDDDGGQAGRSFVVTVSPASYPIYLPLVVRKYPLARGAAEGVGAESVGAESVERGASSATAGRGGWPAFVGAGLVDGSPRRWAIPGRA
jgi:hypothetical protein